MEISIVQRISKVKPDSGSVRRRQQRELSCDKLRQNVNENRVDPYRVTERVYEPVKCSLLMTIKTPQVVKWPPKPARTRT